MSTASIRHTTWTVANCSVLQAELERVRSYLMAHLGQPDQRPLEQAVTDARVNLPEPAALDRLVALFGLSAFERDLLLLCAAEELLDAIGAPGFKTALAYLPEPHWSALTPEGPLRYWRLLNLGSSATLATAPLHLDERILHYLCGVPSIDERLNGYLELVQADGHLTPSQQAHVESITCLWAQPEQDDWPAVHLCGNDHALHATIAAQVSRRMGRDLLTLQLPRLPGNPAEREALLRLCEREVLLSEACLLLQLEATPPDDLANWIQRPDLPVLVSSPEPLRSNVALRLEVGKPSTSEQLTFWQACLGDVASGLNGQLEALTAQFNLPAASIRAISQQSRYTPPEHLAPTLWEGCRNQARVNLTDLAERVVTRTGWDDLVVPEHTRELLQALAAQVRQRAKVYERWGFAARSARGLGISALFCGPSGTGKTLASEVLANELRLDLYRIDLSQLVSKYIGETEKNLSRVFQAAEEGGAVLLFDEADALFGKRSEVRDSHDRFANIEVSYLLQRMENYRGLAILTTNRREALDTAFLRRLRFIVTFPFPDVGLRTAIWQRMFPTEAPTEALDFRRLARLNATGGNIRNIALGAAFLAADAGQPIRMQHLRTAAGFEFAKLEKPLPAAEMEAWS
ncbi:MAG: ATPase central domain-containing protein [Puniceicoccaceae bacterium 5H]|nr:MAG: ATPase central domain-containing protein [Puniceicoccaceae bacterium 5H]